MQTGELVHRLVLRVHELEHERRPHVAADLREAITALRQQERELHPRGGLKHVREQELRRTLSARRSEDDAV